MIKKKTVKKAVDKKSTGKPAKKKSLSRDRKLIAAKQPHEVRSAAKAMGTTRGEVVEGVKRVGHSRKAVSRFVKSRTDKGW